MARDKSMVEREAAQLKTDKRNLEKKLQENKDELTKYAISWQKIMQPKDKIIDDLYGNSVL